MKQNLKFPNDLVMIGQKTVLPDFVVPPKVVDPKIAAFEGKHELIDEAKKVVAGKPNIGGWPTGRIPLAPGEHPPRSLIGKTLRLWQGEAEYKHGGIVYTSAGPTWYGFNANRKDRFTHYQVVE